MNSKIIPTTIKIVTVTAITAVVFALFYSTTCCALAEARPDKPVSEYDKITEWYTENKSIGGTYKLKDDLILDNQSLSLGALTKPITIDAGKHMIVIKNGGSFSLWSRPSLAATYTYSVQVRGSKNSGLIRLEDSGSLNLSYVRINASQGPAVTALGCSSVNLGENCLLEASGGNGLTMSGSSQTSIADKNIEFRAVDGTALCLKDTAAVDWSFLKDSCRITASGKDAVGIAAYGKHLSVTNAQIEATGKAAIGIYSKGNVELSQVGINVSGEDSSHVYLDGQDLKLTQDDYQSIAPDFPEIESPDDFGGDRGGGGTFAPERRPNTINEPTEKEERNTQPESLTDEPDNADESGHQTSGETAGSAPETQVGMKTEFGFGEKMAKGVPDRLSLPHDADGANDYSTALPPILLILLVLGGLVPTVLFISRRNRR